MINPYAIGNFVYLRAPNESDIQGPWHSWFSDPEISKNLIDRYWPNTIEQQMDFFSQIQNDRSKLVLSIIDKESETHIGVCGLSSINWVHRYADISLVVGDKNYHNGTYAIECLDLLLQIAFERLNLRNIKGGFRESNRHTRALMKLFKFEIVGQYPELLSYGNRLEGLVSVQLSARDWRPRNSCAFGSKSCVSEDKNEA